MASFNSGQMALSNDEVVGLKTSVKHISRLGEGLLYLASADIMLYLFFALEEAFGHVPIS